MTIAERQVDKGKATRFYVLTQYQTIQGLESEENPSYDNIVK